MSRTNFLLRELQGTFLRSKIQWHEEGEKSTKFFFNLEKSRQKKKVMKQLLTDQSLIITDQHEIMKEQVKFYTNLYQAGETDNESRNQILCELRRFLSPMDVEACEANIHYELKAALLAMEPNKSPGLDGLTAEFYKVFWRDFIDIFTRLIETSFHDNELCESMKISILTLIPKKGDLRSLNNWRPISLLNVDYKMIAKALAKRITSISKNIISEDQTCCIPGRDISENVLTMQNVIEYVNSYNKPGFILKIDQYKAFDRVDHNYLFEVAEKLGFGPKLLKWIKLFYTNIEGRIKHNGYISDPFPVKRGVRQGCPLSAMLYVLCAEPFLEAIINCPYIHGIKFCEVEAKIFQHADDTTFFVSSITSIYSIFNIIKLYERASGSSCNIDKTELLSIGCSHVNPSNFDFPVRKDFITVLGVAIGNDKKSIEKENWEKKVTSCRKLLNTWKGRKLSFKGKSLIINSLIVTRLVY
ncbi:pol-like protein [Apostichopus japonicus]|uniref:Pol-like protein n=1 Tax=Stichopus japonicus TaxID=307972 RepID=A0A2G8JCX6_STIJA|nr:pol-like protein [Apostichopus japonicus]